MCIGIRIYSQLLLSEALCWRHWKCVYHSNEVARNIQGFSRCFFSTALCSWCCIVTSHWLNEHAQYTQETGTHLGYLSWSAFWQVRAHGSSLLWMKCRVVTMECSLEPRKNKSQSVSCIVYGLSPEKYTCCTSFCRRVALWLSMKHSLHISYVWLDRATECALYVKMQTWEFTVYARRTWCMTEILSDCFARYYWWLNGKFGCFGLV